MWPILASNSPQSYSSYQMRYLCANSCLYHEILAERHWHVLWVSGLLLSDVEVHLASMEFTLLNRSQWGSLLQRQPQAWTSAKNLRIEIASLWCFLSAENSSPSIAISLPSSRTTSQGRDDLLVVKLCLIVNGLSSILPNKKIGDWAIPFFSLTTLSSYSSLRKKAISHWYVL